MAAPRINLLQFLSDADFPYMKAFMANPGLDVRMGRMADAGDAEGLMRIVDKYLGRASQGPSPVAPRGLTADNPHIRQTVMERLDWLSPQLRQRVEAGDPDAVMEAYATAGKPPKRGRPSKAESAAVEAPPRPLPLGGKIRGRTTEDSIRELAKPADQVAAESIASQFDRAVRPGMDVPARQMDLPLQDDMPAMDDLLFRQDVMPARPTGPSYEVRARNELVDMPAPRRVADGPADVPASARPRIGPKAKAAAAAAALGAGAAALAPRRIGDGADQAAGGESDLVTGGEADLVEESRPAPKVITEDAKPKVASAPVDYSMQARALINRLNDMRRAAGGEVPEATAMMAEINRLLELGNKTRRATMVAAPGDDASRLFQQAQALIDQVNQMYRQGMTPNSPEVQRIMSEVRRLQAQGDAIRNRRAG